IYLVNGQAMLNAVFLPDLLHKPVEPYVLDTPFALTGSHNIAKATAKGNTVILFVASASDKQWPSSQKTLKAIVDSFHV
ncbi:PsbP domain-containing protein 6, chloroplastic, partial [Tanacetum coccineum]